MAEALVTGSIQAPGFQGLNLQDSSVELSNGYALEAYNCVIDKYGRVGARKGWTKVNPTAFNSGPVRTIFEFIKADGNLTFAAADNKIYGTHPTLGTYLPYPVAGTIFHPSSSASYTQTGTTVSVTCASHGLSTGMSVYFGPVTGTADEGIYVITVTSGSAFTFTSPSSETTSGTANIVNILTTYTITDDNWQAVNFPLGTGATASAHAIWVQADHIPLVMHKLGTPPHTHIDGYGFQRLGDVATLPTGYTVSTFKPSCALNAYGRLWVANVDATDTQTVYFSDLQDPSNWTTGTSGRLDISAVVPTGDPIVALAQHNGFLVIFCKRHVVIYSGAKDPSTMTLEDTIMNIGCIARDSVASIHGSDLVFLSDTGVQSLGRLVSEKSLPLRDVSKNVRDDLIASFGAENLADVKGVYVGQESFYLLSMPSVGFTYCFDTRGMLENGAAKSTIWTGIKPTAFCVTANRDLYLGQNGYIGKYEDYTDNGTAYRWSYYTTYFNLDQPSILKILKKIGLTVIGGGAQVVTIKWGFDYSSDYNSSTIVLAGSTIYEYGIAEYGIAEYTNGIAIDVAKFNASGTGKTLQIGFESDINGYPLSVQKVDVAVKTGKSF
jgi:hypothetical protein